MTHVAEDSYDVVVVGAGGAGMTAAPAAPVATNPRARLAWVDTAVDLFMVAPE